MQQQINIHPVSDSEASHDDDAEFESPPATPGTPISVRSVRDSQGSGPNGQASLLNATSQAGSPALAGAGSNGGAQALEEGSDLDDSLTIRDLDTGRELHFQQRNTIRDLNTGNVYLLDTGEEVGGEPDLAHSSGGYTDLISGTKMSAEEFDAALGLAASIGNARRRRLEGLQDSEGLPGPEASGSKKVKAGKAKQWLKKRSTALFQRSRLGKSSSGRAGALPGPAAQEAAEESGATEDDGDDDTASARSHSTAASTPVRRSASFQEEMAADERAGAPASVGVPVKVHVHRKLHKDLAHLHLVQELHAHSGVMWTMKFSKNGQYLASAGQDAVIRVWEIVPSRGGPPPAPSASQAEETQEENGHASTADEEGEGEGDRAVLKAQPLRVYSGHKQDVLDVAWSKSQFLLSASMDKSVRLWHISMDDCLRVFSLVSPSLTFGVHTDFVTALDFHPVDDKFFVSGSIDGKVRVWNIPEQRVVDWADVHEMVTAVAWSHTGEQAVVGTMKGKCRFYTCAPRTHALEYTGQIDVKNRRGKSAKGRKITGMQYAPGETDSLLITSNDSRIRLYSGFSLRCKYKGNSNRNTQIRATFSQGGNFVICGSDDGWVYVWSLANSSQEKSSSYECFHAHDDIVTVAVFAPETAWLPVSPSGTDKPKTSGSVADGLGRLGLRSRLSKEESAAATAAASSAVACQANTGPVMLTAGYGGEIKVFECLTAPQML